MLWQILASFVFRLCFGLATAMALTSPNQVSSGFYRIHLWVLLGLGTFGSLIVYSQHAVFDASGQLVALAICGTILSYIGSVVWLYENTRFGMIVLVAVALTFFFVALLASPLTQLQSPGDWCWLVADTLTGSLLMGATFAAMLLGHWYLNSPTMKLNPLWRLLGVLAAVLAARIVVCGSGLVIHVQQGELADGFSIATVALRWLAGLVGLAGMTWMAIQTLKIPNTQSATGILYVALVFVFLGELASALLSFRGPIPV